MTGIWKQYRGVAAKAGVDAVALVPGPNFVRAFGASFHGHERPLVIVIPTSGPPAAIVPNLEMKSFAALDFPGEVFDWRDQDGYSAAFAALAAHMPLASLGVEGQVMRVFVHHALAAAYPGLKIDDAEAEISGLRIIKTDAEIAALESAIAISEAALGEVLDSLLTGQTENEIRGRLIQAIFAHGAEGLAFGPIVAAGANAALPHATSRDVPVQAGEALLIDFGARAQGFCADITRTVFVGHVEDDDAALFQAVLAANQKGHDVTAPGRTAHDVDDAVTAVLEGSPFAEHIRHKTGHGLGRAVHEAPYIMRGNTQVLEPGMVFTNEPGLYRIGRVGVRIEDDILVTENGCRSLTTFPRELQVVG